MASQNNRAPLLYYVKLCASFQSHRWIQTGVIVRKCSIRVKIGDFFVPCDLEIWWMTLKNNRAPLLCYFKLCTSFQSHWWIQTGVTVGNAQFGSKSAILCPVWPWNLTWKTIGNLFYATSSFVHHFVTICKFRKRPIWVKIGDLLYRATLKFDWWLWKTKGHLFYVTSSFVHHFVAMVELKLELWPGNA